MKVVANGEAYDLASGAYDVVGNLDKAVVPVGFGKGIVYRQLCATREEKRRFFVLSMLDFDVWSRERVQVWPVSVDEAKVLAEDLVDFEAYKRLFGKIGA